MTHNVYAYMTFCRSVLAKVKCGEAQAGTPAQHICDVRLSAPSLYTKGGLLTENPKINLIIYNVPNKYKVNIFNLNKKEIVIPTTKNNEAIFC